MVHVVAIKHIHDFCRDNPRYASRIKAWLTLVKSCKWDKPNDIIRDFGAPSTDILGNSSNRVVFNIAGNHIRLIAKYQMSQSVENCTLYLKWIGTHADYDRMCKANLQYTIDMFRKII
jgi:mRNA interferase HigB